MPAVDETIDPTSPGLAPRSRGVYDLVLALFCSLLLISNIAAVKLIQFGGDLSLGGFQVLPLVLDGGALLFPLTYVLGDVLAEVYGLRGARRAIVLGGVVSVIASATFVLVGALPSATDWGNQEAFTAVLGFVPRIVLASLLAYAVGQLLNAWVLVRLKRRTREGSLWARLLGSTIVGELADTVIFCLVAFAGIISAPAMLNYIVVGYLWKVAVETALLPVTYRVIALVKRHEPSYRAA